MEALRRTETQQSMPIDGNHARPKHLIITATHSWLTLSHLLLIVAGGFGYLDEPNAQQ